MVKSLVLVSVGVLALAASFLLLHQVTPPRTAKRTTAMRSPFGFIAYLLFHQVTMPMQTMASGNMTTLSQKTRLSFCAVRVRGRSSVDFGRMLIRSSSALSQLIMFMNRSRLPRVREPMARFSAHCEVPTTTKRPAGVPCTVAEAPRVNGPFFPFLGSIAPLAATSLTAMLSSVVPKSFSTVLLPPDLISSERGTGKAVGTRARGRVMGLGSYCKMMGISGP